MNQDDKTLLDSLKGESTIKDEDIILDKPKRGRKKKEQAQSSETLALEIYQQKLQASQELVSLITMLNETYLKKQAIIVVNPAEALPLSEMEINRLAIATNDVMEKYIGQDFSYRQEFVLLLTAGAIALPRISIYKQLKAHQTNDNP